MKLVCSSEGIMGRKFPAQGARDIASAGFREVMVDMRMFYPEDVLEENDFLRAKEQLERNELHMVLGYVPAQGKKKKAKKNPEKSEENTVIRTLMEIQQKRAEDGIRMCGQADCHFLVVEPLPADVISRSMNPSDAAHSDTTASDAKHMSKDDIWDINKRYYLHLAALAKEHDIMILLQNQCRDLNEHQVRGLCSDGVQAAEWVDRLNEAVGEERFGFCMDVGICTLCGQNMYDFAKALGDRLKAVVVRDCDVMWKNAMLPFTCVNNNKPQADWLKLIRGLREISFDGMLVMYFRDTAAAFSAMLRPKLVSLAKDIADYLQWQIEIETQLKKYPKRVLFGAGNMCRNYMKCYGEEYPPLFTCDNNSRIWGTEFCGLEVKAPESLKDIPSDCVIFICNMYYREIESQLREMGITNPIAYFNDEYMPTFYVDRLEDR